MNRRRVVLPLIVLATACIHTFRNVDVRPLDGRRAEPIVVVTPVKAHLVDGGTVVFLNGVSVDGETVRGLGYRYDLTLRDSAAVVSVPLDSIVGMEVFQTKVDAASSVFISLLATGATALGAALLAIAIFGSCPTYYADSAGVALLQGEGFSYSIAPLFESRDVDRLRIRAAPDGSLRLEVRNEALETHYLNHLELLDVEHGISELALGDESNRLLVVADVGPVARAVDRGGRDIRGQLRAGDGEVYRTDARVLAQARAGDLEDWIELTAPAPPGSDSVAIVLRLRNSLLNTILLYDIMLGDPGARSLDWVGRDLEQVGPAVELAQWYQKRMGMDIAVADSIGYRGVAHLKDTGPIAWKDVAVVVPVLTRDSVRIRLRFPADNWRIDRVGIAGRVRRAVPRVLPLAEVRDAAEEPDTTALASLSSADGRYLETSPGQRFTAVFRPRVTTGTGAHTFFLASQGYYMEWVRRGWLAAPRVNHTFVPSDSALADAVARWRVSQDSLEARFMATRIPVR